MVNRKNNEMVSVSITSELGYHRKTLGFTHKKESTIVLLRVAEGSIKLGRAVTIWSSDHGKIKTTVKQIFRRPPRTTMVFNRSSEVSIAHATTDDIVYGIVLGIEFHAYLEFVRGGGGITW